MELHTPEYFNEFHCIADKCKDCCCIGWEIDIDSKTNELYNNINTDFGNKLKSGISSGKPKHFILDKNGRCPFLNSQNLCEVFINIGEENLCKICAEHPRYYEWFKDIKEGGIGLCCEEAARIILSQNKPFKIYKTNIPFEDCDDYNSELYTYLYQIRNNIIYHLENTTLPLNLRIRNVLWYAYTIQINIDSDFLDDVELINIDEYNKFDLLPILEYYSTLETLDNTWISYLKNCIVNYKKYKLKLKDFEIACPEVDSYLQNISIYFVWRYFLKGLFNSDIISKIKLMAVSVAVIKFLFLCKWVDNKKMNFNDFVEIAKQYSKEIEYSEDNLLALEDTFFNNTDFSVDNLIGLF